MSDGGAALSLINSVLTATVSGFGGLTELEAFDEAVLNGRDYRGRVHFRGRTAGGGFLIVETEVRWDLVFGDSALTSAASRFAASDFGGGAAAAAPWMSQIKDAYAIQFVDYGYVVGDEKSRCGEYFRVLDSVSEDGRVGIHVIEIALPRIATHFPAEAEICLGWGSVEWWYYVLRFSDRFTEAEIRKCLELGMGEEIVGVLRMLKAKEWDTEARRGYLSEIDEIERDRAEFERKLLKARRVGEEKGWKIGHELGEKEGREAGALEMLLMRWLEGFQETGQVKRGRLAPGPTTLSGELVREWWSRAVMPLIAVSDADTELCEEFIEALSASGVTVE
jgi:hypothetical protein